MTEWTDHVKKHASENKVTYKQAMTDSKESYHKRKNANTDKVSKVSKKNTVKQVDVVAEE